MTKPLVVSIPHQLGAAEARRRLETGIDHIKATYGGKLAVLDHRWNGDRLEFRVSALAQTVSGTVDVAGDLVTLSLELPWMLAMLAEKAKTLIQKQGHLMLEKK